MKKILIVGGVAGGASFATRARRLMEDADITLFERGPHVSFANCGLPYHIGKVIKEEKSLLVATPQLFENRFNINAKTEHDILRIHPEKNSIEVKNLRSGEIFEETYDHLVLSPGASPLRPSLPGIDLENIFTLRNIPDMEKIKEWIETHNAKSVVVIGAGFIGLEMAENLSHLKMEVSIVEKLPQIIPPMDAEMAFLAQEHLQENRVKLFLNDGIKGFSSEGKRVLTETENGQKISSDLVILSIGVRPETKLAQEAGLAIGARGGIQVNDRLQTSIPNIWAVGDAIEVKETLTGESLLLPLAGPANRQGRMVAENIAGSLNKFRGVQGTAILEVFGLQVAFTGLSEKRLKFLKKEDYQSIYLYPNHHVAYYPGAETISLKVIYEKSSGKLLGAQAVGKAGIDKRIDVLASFIQKAGTIDDLKEAELCYAPQFGAAKDPVNLAGMIAGNDRDGISPIIHWSEALTSSYFILDVREPSETQSFPIPQSYNIPLPQLRQRFAELPKDRKIAVTCAVGQRAHVAVCLLRQKGYDAYLITGSARSYRQMVGAKLISGTLSQSIPNCAVQSSSSSVQKKCS